MSIKYFLLLTLVSFSYQAYHCLDSFKACNIYNNPKVEHCALGAANLCLECEDNYSASNDRSRCINIPNCASFDDEGKCLQCQNYYNFDEKGNCVTDYCLTYNPNNEERKCLQCYPGFYMKDNNCVKIPIPYCLSGDDKTCTECTEGTKLVDGACEVPTTFVEGCEKYNNDRSCIECTDDYTLSNNVCTFQGQCQGYPTIDSCSLCEDGYYPSLYTHQCIGYDGSKEKAGSGTSSDNAFTINIRYAFPLLLLLIII